MPFGDEGQEDGIGLALSGGGYRAMLFHLGVLWRLNELGILAGVKRISSVSGGSLVAGRLAARWDKLRFDSGVAANLREEVADPVMAFAETRVDLPLILKGLIPGLSAARLAARVYDRRLVEETMLEDLPDKPVFVFNATHLASATSWRFSKHYMGSYRLGLVRSPAVSLGSALAASAAFPPFLSPLTLKLDPREYEWVEGADLFDRDDIKRTVALTDGGVYDNLGLETVWRRFATVLSSDAGGQLSVKAGGSWNWFSQLRRVIDTSTEQSRALRRRALVRDFIEGRRRGTLWRAGSHIEEYPAGTPFPVHESWRPYLASLPTRLSPFSTADRERLVNWGYLVSDVGVRSWVIRDAPAPSSLPIPRSDFALPAPAYRDPPAGDIRPTTSPNVDASPRGELQ